MQLNVHVEKGKIIRADLVATRGKMIATDITFNVMGESNPKLESTLKAWLKAYLKGEKSSIELPFSYSDLTSFTQKVLRFLPSISSGKTMTYSQVAAAIGSPKAYRAVGSACGRNPFLLLVPCHRVVGVSSLGGFAAGLDIKKALLALELNLCPIHSSKKAN